MTDNVQIDCGTFLLRRWRLGDKEALIRHADNPKIWRNVRDLFPYPYTEQDADEWLAHATVEEDTPWVFAIEIDGEAGGTISLLPRSDVERHSAELGYWLGEAFWSRGIMTAAVRALTERAFEQSDFYRIYADVFAWNPASMRVLEKAGYRREAVLTRAVVKDGVLMDQVIYAITRDPGLRYFPAT
jgi:ribosomal-protein-alanine N-acetyltransferase